MNNLFTKAKSFFQGLFAPKKKVVVFPQEEDQDLFIGV
jgi:hypothetical protein